MKIIATMSKSKTPRPIRSRMRAQSADFFNISFVLDVECNPSEQQVREHCERLLPGYTMRSWIVATQEVTPLIDARKVMGVYLSQVVQAGGMQTCDAREEAFSRCNKRATELLLLLNEADKQITARRACTLCTAFMVKYRGAFHAASMP